MANPNPSRKWKKGETGNRNGAPDKQETLSDLMKQLLEEREQDQKYQNKKLFVRKMFIDAMKGNTKAQAYIWDRLEGKAQQSIDMTSQGEQLGVMVYLPKKD